MREHQMRNVRRLKTDNRRTPILAEVEKLQLLEACPQPLAWIVRLALITSVRIGEVLAIR